MFSMWDGRYLPASEAAVMLAEPPRPPRRSPSASRVPDTLEALIRRDSKSQKIDELLWREQRKLKRLSTDAAWHQYLRVETAHMDRALRWLELGTRASKPSLRRRR
jgi:hypothetical protein